MRPAKVCSHPGGWAGTCPPATPGASRLGLRSAARASGRRGCLKSSGGQTRSMGLMLFQRASTDPAANTSPHPARRHTHSQEPLGGGGGEDPPAHKRRAQGWTAASPSQPKAPPPPGPAGQQALPGGGPEATQAPRGRSRPGRTCTAFSAARPAALWHTPHSPITRQSQPSSISERRCGPGKVTARTSWRLGSLNCKMGVPGCNSGGGCMTKAIIHVSTRASPYYHHH